MTGPAAMLVACRGLLRTVLKAARQMAQGCPCLRCQPQACLPGSSCPEDVTAPLATVRTMTQTTNNSGGCLTSAQSWPTVTHPFWASLQGERSLMTSSKSFTACPGRMYSSWVGDAWPVHSVSVTLG